MPDIARAWHTAAEQARRENADRARRVLAHPDLVERLAEAPARIPDPYAWSGWIPPRAQPEESCGGACGKEYWPCTYSQHRSKVNDSPVRKQLVDIAAEAMRREQIPLDEAEQAEPVDAGQAEQVAAIGAE